MASVPSKVADRLAAGLKRFQPILSGARARDVNEADTVVIVMDLLSEVFGYDKYAEITREHCIRGTYCDLAVRLDTKLQLLMEVKAIGLDLKDSHLRQVVDYAANQGVEWVALTNGILWQVYKVGFGKPIEHELVLELDLIALNPRTSDHIESLFLLTRESIQKSALVAYQDHREATSRFYLAALLLTDPVLEVLRRELRRLSPETKVPVEELRSALTQEVLKREVVEGPKAEQAKRKVQRAASKSLRKSGKDDGEEQAQPQAAAKVPFAIPPEAIQAGSQIDPTKKPPEPTA
jgi:predicted type IV restriction endonuclease